MKDINSGNIHMLESMILNAENICIVTHMKPDGDAMGSSTALYHYLMKLGKTSKIVINDPYPSYLSFLISEDLGRNIITYESQPSHATDAISGSDLIICLDFNAFHRTDRLEEALYQSTG